MIGGVWPVVAVPLFFSFTIYISDEETAIRAVLPLYKLKIKLSMIVI